MGNWCSKCEWGGNDTYASFCKLCGAILVEQEKKNCPNCGNQYLYPSNVKFCDRCGNALVELNSL